MGRATRYCDRHQYPNRSSKLALPKLGGGSRNTVLNLTSLSSKPRAAATPPPRQSWSVQPHYKVQVVCDLALKINRAIIAVGTAMRACQLSCRFAASTSTSAN